MLKQTCTPNHKDVIKARISNNNFTIFALLIASIPVGILLLWLHIFYSVNIAIIALILLVIALAPLLFIRPLYGIIAFIIARNIVDIFNTSSLAIGPLEIMSSSILGILIIPWGLYIVLRQYPLVTQLLRIPLVLPWLIFLGISLLSVMNTFSVSNSIMHMLRLIDFFILYIVSYTQVQRYKEGKLLQIGILSSLVVPILFALWQWVTNTGLDSGDVANRVFGSFVHPNILAYILMVVLGICIILWRITPNKLARVALFIFGIISIGILALTFTRGAWLGILIIIAIWLFSKPKLFTFTLLIALFIYGIFSLAGPSIHKSISIQYAQNPIIQRLQPDTDQETSSVQWRLRTWKETLPAFYERPWIGHGIGSFENVRTAFITYESDLTALEAHNDYLRLAIEVGALGLATYILLYLSILKNLVSTLSKLSYTQKSYAIGLVAITVALFIMSFGDNILRNVPLQWIYWTLVGTTISLCSINKQKLS